MGRCPRASAPPSGATSITAPRASASPLERDVQWSGAHVLLPLPLVVAGYKPAAAAAAGASSSSPSTMATASKAGAGAAKAKAAGLGASLGAKVAVGTTLAVMGAGTVAAAVGAHQWEQDRPDPVVARAHPAAAAATPLARAATIAASAVYYRHVVLTAAGSLATRYNPTVGAILSWNSPHPDYRVIVDNMMNLELLFWAAKHGGDPSWHDIAVNHALKTREHHVRPDGGTYHVVTFNAETGEVARRGTHQGYHDESTWARGQAWAIYGFTMAYRETGDRRFLDTARLTARYFLRRLPADKVPYWDFQAPRTPDAPRDSSAAAIAASALLELARRDPDDDRRATYLDSARAIIRSLSSSAYLSRGVENMAVLLHGTSNKPRGRFDHGLVYGDYYFAEALLRLRQTHPGTPSLPVAAVRASADEYGDVPANTLDHDLETRWSALGSGQWIEYDLGRRMTVTKVSIAFDRGDERAARFGIETSTDGQTWIRAMAAISSGQVRGAETYDIPDDSARYVRIVGDGNTSDAWNGITEVNIR